MSLHVLVVDDEPLARTGVVARLRTHEDMEIVGECGTGEEALLAITSLAPDLLFLDVEMPGLSGLEVLAALPADARPMVIFLTAFEEYAIPAFEVQALDYLLKPINTVRFESALDRARRLWELKQQERHDGPLRLRPQPQWGVENQPLQRFAIRKGAEVSFVCVEDVDWIEGLGDYAGLHVGPRTHLIREPLTALSEALDPKHFLRVHRSSIVRLDRIQKIEPIANGDYLITLQNRSSIRTSRTYSRAVRSLMQNNVQRTRLSRD